MEFTLNKKCRLALENISSVKLLWNNNRRDLGQSITYGAWSAHLCIVLTPKLNTPTCADPCTQPLSDAWPPNDTVTCQRVAKLAPKAATCKACHHRLEITCTGSIMAVGSCHHFILRIWIEQDMHSRQILSILFRILCLDPVFNKKPDQDEITTSLTFYTCQTTIHSGEDKVLNEL